MDTVHNTKRCRRCQQMKPLDAFRSNGRGGRKRDSDCKGCRGVLDKTVVVYSRAMLRPRQSYCPLISRPCTRCQEIKPIEMFHLRRKEGRIVRRSWCVECESSTRKEKWHLLTPEQREHSYQRVRAYKQENSDKARQYDRTAYIKHYQKRLDKATNWRMKKRYSIGLGDYQQMVKERDNLCDICKTRPPKGDSLCVDHCHETGLVRGLLCRNCNAGLGHFLDNLCLLIEAQEYLIKSLDAPTQLEAGGVQQGVQGAAMAGAI